MFTKDFYEVIDAELDSVLEAHQADTFLQKTNPKEIDKRKSYALLVWFLEFYAKKRDYQRYITDAQTIVNEPNVNDAYKNADASCDIIFPKTDSYGKKIYYILQSKWNNLKNSEGEITRTEISKSLNDFETILRKDIQKVNQKMLAHLENFYEHIENNGEVKFIFLCLCKQNPSAQENIDSFIKQQPLTGVEILDIERLKVDYIDRKIKKLDPQNPLENYRDPAQEKITLPIEKLGKQHNTQIEIEKPFSAYILLLRPKTVHELFKQYGFLLFAKNVRNPLLQSNFNTEIERTALENPAYFWYYNNGITAITRAPFPKIRPQAEKIELNTLQIINGGQTVYSLYYAYEHANPQTRIEMDTNILITLRLLQSGGQDFDTNVTRYTNSQNPISDRDFRANDEVQNRLQAESFKTKYWYERRAGEFRTNEPEVAAFLKTRDIQIVANEMYAAAYLAYHLQAPYLVFNNYRIYHELNQNWIFLSPQQNPAGLYEYIFNQNTRFVDMYVAYKLVNIKNLFYQTSILDNLASDEWHMLCFFKIIYTAFVQKKTNSKEVDINLYVSKIFEKYTLGDESVWQVIVCATNWWMEYLDYDDSAEHLALAPLMSDLNIFKQAKESVQYKSYLLTAKDIETIPLSSEILDFIKKGEIS